MEKVFKMLNGKTVVVCLNSWEVVEEGEKFPLTIEGTLQYTDDGLLFIDAFDGHRYYLNPAQVVYVREWSEEELDIP